MKIVAAPDFTSESAFVDLVAVLSRNCYLFVEFVSDVLQIAAGRGH
jgi:hypothetical protein